MNRHPVDMEFFKHAAVARFRAFLSDLEETSPGSRPLAADVEASAMDFVRGHVRFLPSLAPGYLIQFPEMLEMKAQGDVATSLEASLYQAVYAKIHFVLSGEAAAMYHGFSFPEARALLTRGLSILENELSSCPYASRRFNATKARALFAMTESEPTERNLKALKWLFADMADEFRTGRRPATVAAFSRKLSEASFFCDLRLSLLVETPSAESASIRGLRVA